MPEHDQIDPNLKPSNIDEGSVSYLILERPFINVCSTIFPPR